MGGHSAPLTDDDPYGADPTGVWFNRIHSFEVTPQNGDGVSRTVHFPKSCLHCDDAPCVTVCPTGDRKSVVWGKIVSVRVDSGGRRIIKKKKHNKKKNTRTHH